MSVASCAPLHVLMAGTSPGLMHPVMQMLISACAVQRGITPELQLVRQRCSNGCLTPVQATLLPRRHDSTKRAVCPRWLHGTCPLGTSCPLQHQRKPELMPICMHFLKVGSRLRRAQRVACWHVMIAAHAQHSDQ